ncbi:hypothetical protein Taro_034116 [Colocasia esculenta]|uniref:Uncharacterized protein n=1 Tax=Colocasia esculenta TaxID=4460 RepID=A0A843W6N2_COLES|nr:hypothetical protein [Colocasia esculenta]
MGRFRPWSGFQGWFQPLPVLRIGDVENGSSSLDFVQNMASLSTLILRNCKISGTIRLDFGMLKSLRLLDLSFNNLTGQLPASLFNLTTLTHLFLGNNSLTGSLPELKSSLLVNISKAADSSFSATLSFSLHCPLPLSSFPSLSPPPSFSMRKAIFMGIVCKGLWWASSSHRGFFATSRLFLSSFDGVQPILGAVLGFKTLALWAVA